MRCRPLLVSLYVLASAWPGGAAQAPLPAALQERIEAALHLPDPRVEAAAIERAAALEGRGLEPLFAELGRRLAEAKADEAARIALQRLSSDLCRRRGDQREALALLREIPAGRRGVADLLAEAELCDATGQDAEARKGYQAVLGYDLEDALRQRLLLRLALLAEPGGRGRKPTEGGSALARFAKDPGLSQDLRNQAAIVLALLDRFDEAVDLYVTGEGEAEAGEGGARYRAEIRLSEWGLQGKRFATAQEHAWTAVEVARGARDRRYALAILVETYRRPGELGALIERFAGAEELSPEAKECWIDLLRETGEVDEALRLFRASAGGSFTVDMRRQLLEMCRETGQDTVLVEAYADLIRSQPRFLEWREGLARFHQERGDRAAARAAWTGYETVTEDPRYLMAAAASTMALGLDELAVRLARACGRIEGQSRQALLFLFELHRDRGRIDEARAALTELDRTAEPTDPARLELADAWSRIGDDVEAVRVLEALVAASGAQASPDTRMKLALMLSEVGQEERALAHWLALWREIQSIPRRRYVEERLMTVAARLGKLAGIAVELERKLARGEADEREAGLLVRLYVRVKDAVSATEVLEEHMKGRDRARAEVLQEKARIFLSCQDYHDYEGTIRTLIEVDPEGRADYLRQLAMSAMERGQREEARGILTELQGVEADSMHDEFEAGVLAMAGMREEALDVYRRGLARNPDRIDAWLLLSNLQKELGRHERSAGMFQYLAATADKDDLFTIAIDGILNMRDGRGNRGAPDRLVRWARRVVLERIASRPDKLYLYRLVADLSEEVNDSGMAIRALAAALPIAGEQRTPLLRELMELARKRAGGDTRPRVTMIGRPGMPLPARKDVDPDLLDFGRRILGQGELVPPQVYLDLGDAFLQAEEVVNAQRTFQLMAGLPEFAELRRRIARSFEVAGYPAEALRVYQRILAVEGQDLGLILKVGELFEQVGRLGDARELYERGVELWLSRTPLSRTGKLDEEPVRRPGQPIPYSYARNTEEGERARPWFEAGLRATLGEGEAAEAWFEAQDRILAADLAQVTTGRGAEAVAADRLARHPRLQRRAALFRALALAAERVRELDARDRALCEAFPADAVLLETCVRDRLAWGFDRSARDLVLACAQDDDAGRRLRLLVGAATLAEAGRLTIAEVATRLLPTAMLEGEAQARRLLLRTDLARVEAEDTEHLPLLVTWAARAGEPDLALGFARHWLRALGKGGANLYGAIDSMLRCCRRALDGDRYRSLVLDLLDRVVEDPQKYARFAQSLPQLRPLLGFERLERTQVERLLQSRLDSGDQYLYGLEQLFRYLAPEDRGPVLREHWMRFPKSQRAMFLLRLLAVLEERVDEGLSGFLERSFATALAEADNKDLFSYYVGQLEDAVANPDLVLAFYRILSVAGVGGPAVEAYKAAFLLRAGRMEEAWRSIAPVFEAVVTMGRPTSTDQHRLNSAWYQLLNKIGEGGLDRLLVLCDEREQRAGKTLDLWRLRVDLVTRFGRHPAQEAVLRKAVAAFPDERLFEVRLQGLLRARDRDGEVLAALEAKLRDKPDDEAIRRQLIATYRRLRHPLRVAELEAAIPAKADQGGDADAGAAHRRPRQPPATVERVAEAWAGDRKDEALQEYHRLWRSYSQLDSPYAYRMPATARRYLWPKPKPEPGDPAQAPLPRGGLPAQFTAERVEALALASLGREDEAGEEDEKGKEQPERPRKLAAVLATEPAGRVELMRQLRSVEPGAFGHPGTLDLFEALVADRVAEVGARSLLDALLAQERDGLVGQAGSGLLSVLLERDDLELGERLAPVLDGMLRRVDARDPDALRRLAGLFARAGNQDKAAELYLASAQAMAGRTNGFLAGGRALLLEVLRSLDGELRMQTLERLLDIGDPGEFYRDSFDELALLAWDRFVPGNDLLDRIGPILGRVTSPGLRPERRACLVATRLLARAGRLDEALACLEIALCRLEPPTDLPIPSYRIYYEQYGRLSTRDAAWLFSRDLEGFVDAAAWFAAAAERIRVWDEAGRLGQGQAQNLNVLLALRLHELGRDQEAGVLFTRLEAEDSGVDRVWLVDLARAMGREDRAHELERTLCERKALPLGRIAEVLARVAERQGPEAALALGAEVRRWTLEHGALSFLADCAAKAGEDGTAAELRALDAKARAIEAAARAETDSAGEAESR